MRNIPKEFYQQEGFMTVAGLGYTTALATFGFGVFLLGENQNVASLLIVAGGALSTFGFLKQAGILSY
jgi:hypothetical protein